MIKHVYVHIPFCHSICSYCDFTRELRKDQDIFRYIDKLEDDIFQYQRSLDVETIYIGGGTPSLLNDKEVTALFRMLNDYIKINENIEITIEANPDDVTLEKAKLWKELGVNRVSMGAQTFNDKLLKKINRIHSNKQILNAYNIIEKAGITNVSLDLIYNLPGQTKYDIKDDVRYIQTLMPEHISWYSLIPKEGSKLADFKIDHEKEEMFMDIAHKGLKDLGYTQYEISNFSLSKGSESKHNVGYWMTNNWIGLGQGASGHIDGKIINNIGTSKKWKQEIEVENEEEFYTQVMIMGLRYAEGLDMENKLHLKAAKFFEKNIQKAIDNSYLISDNNRLKVSPEYFMLLDKILIEIV